jgi:hypothetical protein
MANINVSRAFIVKNDVLRKLLHEGKGLTLKLWGKDIAEGNKNGRRYTISLTSGWNHTQKKKPQHGVLEEVIYIVETSTVTQEVIDKSEGCDIVDDESNLARYKFRAKPGAINPITREWIIYLNPSKSDVSEILPATP